MWASRTQAFLTDAIRPLKGNWPTLKFCYSFNDIPGPYLRALDVSDFGVAEVHCWITDDMSWNLSSLQLAALLELPQGTELHAKRVMATPLPELRRWFDAYRDPKMISWSAWAAQKGLPLITTEGWGPTNYADVAGLDGEWRWVREFAEIAVHKAIDLGWTGICTSNFCQPHHNGMWEDRAWHRELTGAMRGA